MCERVSVCLETTYMFSISLKFAISSAVLSCLMSNLEKNQLDAECRTLLAKRIEMFEYAAQVAPVETLNDVVRQLQQSPARNWFLLVFSGAFLTLFFIGVSCGRFTKRVPQQLKNK